MDSLRIGHGYDVHRLVVHRRLILAGVEIPYEKGLLGHSDADVLAHAICDGLLGALALGDIGRHFPDSDPAFKDADSMELLAVCVRMAKERGYALGNLDATIIAQAPRLAPYLGSMTDKLAAVLESEKTRINIKATTEEGLGFTGQGEGIAVHCVCLLTRSD